jgi:hypothetical protein
MLDDREQLLTRFEKKSDERPVWSISADYADDDAYHAYKAVDRKQRRLLVKPVGSPCEWLTYQYLLRVVLDPKQTHLALIFRFMAITMSGRKLGPVAEAVADERCDFLEQFDPTRWKTPGEDVAVIDSIEFATDKPAADAIKRSAAVLKPSAERLRGFRETTWERG